MIFSIFGLEMKTMRHYTYFLLLFGLIVASCMNTKGIAPALPAEDATDEVTETTETIEPDTSDVTKLERAYQNKDTLEIWVGSRLDTLPGGGNRLGLVTQENSKYPITEAWECKYQRINGFVFEPGYMYLLKAKVEMVEGQPQLRMVELVNTMIDMDYYRLNDIWAVTHLYAKPIDLSAKRPNMEINLKMMKILGLGGCNNYMGKIERYTTDEILFGPIAGTKMMCENIKTEQAYYNALTATRSYEVKNLSLIFFDEAGNELIRFQKVD